jgi:hypothetical protein
MQIRPGATIVGKSGKKLVVDTIDGDLLICGDRKIGIEAVVQVIPPRPKAFKLGDRVEYIGSDFNLKTQYAGTLEVWEISKKDINSYTCLKPNGRVTSWIEFADLQLVEIAE